MFNFIKNIFRKEKPGTFVEVHSEEDAILAVIQECIKRKEPVYGNFKDGILKVDDK